MSFHTLETLYIYIKVLRAKGREQDRLQSIFATVETRLLYLICAIAKFEHIVPHITAKSLCAHAY